MTTALIEEVIASRLMMLRRGNPDMGGPSHQDKRWAEEIALDLHLQGQEMEWRDGWRIVSVEPTP